MSVCFFEQEATEETEVASDLVLLETLRRCSRDGTCRKKNFTNSVCAELKTVLNRLCLHDPPVPMIPHAEYDQFRVFVQARDWRGCDGYTFLGIHNTKPQDGVEPTVATDPGFHAFSPLNLPPTQATKHNL